MKIYLATPYSHPDAEIREQRFRAVNLAAGQLMRAGHNVYSPISHSHEIAKVCELPTSWEFWAECDRAFIEWADELHVLMADGWKESVGVQAEIDIAFGLGKPVRFVPEECECPHG